MASKSRQKQDSPSQNTENDSTNFADDEDVKFGAAGIEAISKLLQEVYPDQKNHLQTKAFFKFW